MKTLQIINTIILLVNSVAILAMSMYAHNKCKVK
jgi:hypothetical protein